MTNGKKASGMGALASLIAAVFWLWSALEPVPYNIDTIVDDLRWISRLNSFAAGAAFVSALCAVYLFCRQAKK